MFVGEQIWETIAHERPNQTKPKKKQTQLNPQEPFNEITPPATGKMFGI
jgi:hypothetical protein